MTTPNKTLMGIVEELYSHGTFIFQGNFHTGGQHHLSRERFKRLLVAAEKDLSIIGKTKRSAEIIDSTGFDCATKNRYESILSVEDLHESIDLLCLKNDVLQTTKAEKDMLRICVAKSIVYYAKKGNK